MSSIPLPYVPKEAIARNLRDFIYRSKDRARDFDLAIVSARAKENGGREEMDAEHIKNVNDYIRFVDELLRWAPKVSSSGDEVLQKILVFYWVFEQPSLRVLQTPIQPTSISTDLSWLSYWLVSFARELGHYLDTPESAKDVISFYENPKYNQEAAKWEKPDLGWQSFNHWFARHWEDISSARPIAHDDKNDSVIVHSADSMYDGSWDINDGIVTIESINPKGIEWPISKLLQFAGPDFKNGSLMHAFLAPHDYHRQHSPVSGRVIEVKNIQDQVYLQVTKKKEGQGLAPDRGLNRDPIELTRRNNQKKDELYDLDAPDDAGYQWCQTRGLIVIETEKHGKVAILPIGMAQVSSVVITVKEGDYVQKGQNISYFKFGGSDVVLVFQKKVVYREHLIPGETKLKVRERLATFA